MNSKLYAARYRHRLGVARMEIVAYKLVRVRKNGTLGPLFINRKQVLPTGVWLKSQAIRTRGFAFRPGWHACAKMNAPHLSKKGRVWCKVLLRKFTPHFRPASQGGLWYTAKEMRIDGVVISQ